MLLTFNVKYHELIDGRKTTTWRWDWERWAKWAIKGNNMVNIDEWDKHSRRIIKSNIMLDPRTEFLGTNRVLHVKWRNPRNGGLPLGRALLEKMEVMQAYELYEEHAWTDGFNNLGDFQKAILKTGKGEKILADKGVLITMGEWLDGPHDIVCHNCLKRASHASPGTLTQYCAECIADPDNPEGGKLVP